jgi:hypothetical protein
MRNQLLSIAIAGVLVSMSRADTIVIRDAETGKAVAELNIDAKDTKFIHAGRALTVERKAPLMQLRARKWLLPKVAFKEATLDEIGTHLRRPSPYVCDPPEPLPAVINFVVIDRAKRNLRIDIQLEQVSLYDLLASLAKKYGVTITYDDHAITLTDPKAE